MRLIDLKIAMSRVSAALLAVACAFAIMLALPCTQAYAASVTATVPVDCTVDIQKKTDMKAVNAEVLTFQLTPLTEGAPMPETDTVTIACADLVDGKGSATFTMDYDESHVGTWQYTLAQVPGTNPLWGYSYDAYTIEVWITWKDDGTYSELMSTTVAYNDAEEKVMAEFLNIPPEIEVEPDDDDPDGDYSKTGAEVTGIIALIAVLAMASLVLAFFARRRREE